ncbi:septum formation inhibitor Maf [candidate division KSB1 bacterium]|nr:septum formation inhibitor Maf [candidate division KSB1 bacterium]
MNSFLKLPKPLVLASQSPRRLQLLHQVGFTVEVIPSDIEENSKTTSPKKFTTDLAIKKAKNVAAKTENRIVIGADTVVVLDQEILGKPIDKIAARQMLQNLSGREHVVYSGIAIVDSDNNKIISDCESTVVSFRELTNNEIEIYVENDNPLDKAGAYGIQDRSALFVDRIEGCYYNVMGFPLTCFYLNLQKFLSA